MVQSTITPTAARTTEVSDFLPGVLNAVVLEKKERAVDRYQSVIYVPDDREDSAAPRNLTEQDSGPV